MPHARRLGEEFDDVLKLAITAIPEFALDTLDGGVQLAGKIFVQLLDLPRSFSDEGVTPLGIGSHQVKGGAPIPEPTSIDGSGFFEGRDAAIERHQIADTAIDSSVELLDRERLIRVTEYIEQRQSGLGDTQTCVPQLKNDGVLVREFREGAAGMGRGNHRFADA